MQVRKISDACGVEVEGIDLARRSPQDDRMLKQLYDEHGLVVFREQKLTKQQLVDAGAPFGGTMIDIPAEGKSEDVPGLGVYSTRGPNGDLVPQDPDKLVEESDWHTDQAYVTTPNRGKILYAIEAPEEGGQTGFIDGTVTYNALSDDMKKRIENLHVIQSWDKVMKNNMGQLDLRADGQQQLAPSRFPDLAYPVVCKHPITGAKVLNMPPFWAAGIVELPGAEGDALISELIQHIKQPQFLYWHKYRVGDAVLWDNWRFLHAGHGTPGRYVRTLWRTVIQGGPEFGYVLPKAA